MSKKHVFRNLLVTAGLVVAGTAIYLYHDEEAREEVEGLVNRERVKHYVRHDLKAPDALVNAVDSLPNQEINALMDLVEQGQDWSNQASDAFHEIVARAKQMTHQVSDRVHDFVEE